MRKKEREREGGEGGERENNIRRDSLEETNILKEDEYGVAVETEKKSEKREVRNRKGEWKEEEEKSELTERTDVVVP